jgi:hypothetical protein
MPEKAWKTAPPFLIIHQRFPRVTLIGLKLIRVALEFKDYAGNGSRSNE